jgi:hypothetical protein
MTTWTIITVILVSFIIIGSTYNVIRLIKKIRHNPYNMFDLLIGVFLFLLITGFSVYKFFEILI